MFACLYVPPLENLGSRGKLGPYGDGGVGVGPDDAMRIRRGDLASLAREFSPRVEVHGEGLVTLDARGLERLFGDAARLGAELRRAAADRGLPARIAIAPTRPAAWLIVHARAGLTVVPSGEQASWLAPLPLHVLEQIAANGLGPGMLGGGDPSACAGALAQGRQARGGDKHKGGGKLRPCAGGDPAGRDTLGPCGGGGGRAREVEQAVTLLAVLKRWGVKTLGDFTALPSMALSERLGQHGLAWQHLARGEDQAPLVPDPPDERFEETLDLEWPIEGLQPLSFVLARLFDALSAHLALRDRAASALHLYLRLVTRETEHRLLQLPAPVRDARVLRTLALLHLESHPAGAGIDRVTVAADPVPGRVLQASLLTRALPVPEQIATLLARLGAVMGDGRCGMAALVDSHRPGAFAMAPFTVAEYSRAASMGAATADLRGSLRDGPGAPLCVIRRFRVPIPASVAVQDGRPVRVATMRQGLQGGRVTICAGPWRTSGEWWRVADARVQENGSRVQVGWDRDEWDVQVAGGDVYRVYRDRDRDCWFIDGVID